MAAAWMVALSSAVAAQGGGGPPMAPAEAEAYQMGLEMTFVCNPQRHRGLADSESLIVRDAGSLPGTAAFLRSAEGTFLVLEAYDDQAAGHCMVLAWFGGALGPGRYPIRRLGMTTMEEEVGSQGHSFFALAAVRSPEENWMLVTDSGTLEVLSMAAGAPAGTFELTGFALQGATRADGVAVRGTFSALPRDP
jgi:hypothetical protein